MLEPFGLIKQSATDTLELSYVWDEWQIKNYYMFAPEELFTRLDKITNKANTGLTLAIGEWICFRFSRLSVDPVPLQFLQAAWAGSVHPAYCSYVETNDDEWRGPVREPLAVVIAIANDALFCLRDDPNVATRVCWMKNLAKHVLPETQLFEKWFEFTVQRLSQFHTKTVEIKADQINLFEEFPGQGKPVPREAFDPNYDYSPKLAPQLWDRFLKDLPAQNNPFLNNADILRDVSNMPAKPYTYSENS